MAKQGTIGKREWRKWNRGALYRNMKLLISGELRDEENEESFYIPGGVPWQRKTLLLEAKSLLVTRSVAKVFLGFF